MGLLRCWKTMGLPDFLQADNELAFRGSNRYPRSFNIVLRLCLSLGIEVVFIPIGEPWRNGTIENFDDTYNRRFFPTQWFRSYRHLRSQSNNFELLHNKNHWYTCLKGKTPLQVVHENGFRPVLPFPRYQLSRIGPKNPEGTISPFRLLRIGRNLDIFGKHFTLPKPLIYLYVRAKILTDLHHIQIYYGDQWVTTFSYQLPPWMDPNS